MCTMFYLLTVIFPVLLASSRCAKAIKNGSLRSFPELAKVLQQKNKVMDMGIILDHFVCPNKHRGHNKIRL